MHTLVRCRYLCSLLVLVSAAAAPIEKAGNTGHRPPRVVNGAIVSTEYPCARITVRKPLKYLGRHPIEISGVATGERLLFIEADRRHVTRLWIAQFEAIIPGSTELYRYGFEHSIKIGGIAFNPTAFAFSNRKAAADNPADEAALSAKLLRDRGYEIEDELMGARFAAVPDPAKRHELIIFYFENVSSAGHTITDFYDGDSPKPMWHPIAAALMTRGLGSFQLVPGCN